MDSGGQEHLDVDDTLACFPAAAGSGDPWDAITFGELCSQRASHLSKSARSNPSNQPWWKQRRKGSMPVFTGDESKSI